MRHRLASLVPTTVPPIAANALPRIGRCFATTADGRIPLTLDWARLFARLGRVPRVALQTRHARARLCNL